jgi:hypothetical protein
MGIPSSPSWPLELFAAGDLPKYPGSTTSSRRISSGWRSASCGAFGFVRKVWLDHFRSVFSPAQQVIVRARTNRVRGAENLAHEHDGFMVSGGVEAERLRVIATTGAIRPCLKFN